MDSNTNNIIVTILIGLLMALLIHFLACPEPNITNFNNKTNNKSNNNINSVNSADSVNNEDTQDLLEGFTEYNCSNDWSNV